MIIYFSKFLFLGGKTTMKCKKLYRVQGANLGYPSILLDSSYRVNSPKTHLFVSKTLMHHQYYINKRVKQLIKRLLSEENTLHIESLTMEQVKEILDSHDVDPLNLIEFHVLDIMHTLLEENAIASKENHSRKLYMPKSVDVDRCAGGFHLSKFWLKLFCDSLICIKYHNVGTSEISRFIAPYLDEGLHGFGQIDYAPIREQTQEFNSNNSIFDDSNGLNVVYRDLKVIIRERAFVEGTRLDCEASHTVDMFMHQVESAQSEVMKLRREKEE